VTTEGTPTATGTAGATTGDPFAAAASIFADLSDIWAAQAQRWYDRARTDRAEFVPEDAVSETIDLVEHLAPILERSVALTIDLLRPMAQALQSREQPRGQPSEPGA
jgi:hypothetical protein